MALNWLSRTTYAVVETRARIHPADVALLVAADPEGCDARRITFAELHEGVQARARMLWGAGVRPGAHVAIWAGNSLAWIECWLGLSFIGAVTVALNPRLTPHEAAGLLTSVDAKFVLADAAREERLAQVSTGPSVRLGIDPGGALPALADHDETPEPAQIDGERVGLIQFTSGSTGLPKGVQLREGAIAALGACCADRWLLRPDDRIFGVFSFAHNAGTTFTTMAAFTAGATMVLPLSGWAGGAAAASLDRLGTTVLPGVDTIMSDMLASGLRPERLRLVIGGFDAATAERLADELSVEVSNTYGLSECTANVTVGDLRDPLRLRIERIGRPHPGNRVRIVDEDGEPVPPGTPGAIEVDGWVKMNAYYGVPDDQQPFTADGWVRTGDLGSVDERGYISFLGRTKDVIRSGGENVAAYEIERCLETHPAVLQAVVVPAPHERYGEVPYAFVRAEPRREPTADELSAYCRARLAAFKIPRHWEFVDEFPLVGIDKVSKPALKLRAAEALKADLTTTEAT